MFELRTEFTTSAEPEVVWDVLVDLGRWAEWNPFLVNGAGLAAPGERLAITFQQPGGKSMKMRPTVLDVEPARLLRWRGRLVLPGVFTGVHSFELESAGDGTRVQHYERFGGLLLPFVRGMLDTKTRAGFEAMNTAWAARAEAAAG